jgi:hypothetical protein
MSEFTAGIGKFLKTAGKGALENSISKEGRDRLVGNMVKGAMWGAGIGGVTSAARGDSFFGGAGRGALTGGLYGAIGTGLGSGARALDPEAGTYGVKGSAAVYSKQLKAVMQLRKGVASAEANVTGA